VLEFNVALLKLKEGFDDADKSWAGEMYHVSPVSLATVFSIFP